VIIAAFGTALPVATAAFPQESQVFGLIKGQQGQLCFCLKQ